MHKNVKRYIIWCAALCVCAAVLLSGCGRYTFFERVPVVGEVIDKAAEIFWGEDESDMNRHLTGNDLIPLFKNVERPEGFNENVLEMIKKLTPADDPAVIRQAPGEKEDLYESRDEESMDFPENPYEILISDPDMFVEVVPAMLERYIMGCAYDDMDVDSPADLPAERIYSYVEVEHHETLAGDMGAFAEAAVVKICGVNEENTIYTRFGEIGNDGAVHCNLTIYAEHTADYAYTLKGITQTEEVCAAINEEFTPLRADAIPPSQGRCRIEGDVLKVTYDGGQIWKSVPVSMEDFFCNDMGTVASEPYSGSYYISAGRTFFAYGRKLLLSVDEGETWRTVEVGDEEWEELGIRRNYAGVSGDGKMMYDLFCGGRVMGTEGTELYVSTDQGNTWSSLGAPTGEYGSFLINSATFFDSLNGFIAVTDHEQPVYYRTSDGGHTWERIQMDAPAEAYSMIYAPQRQGDVCVFYVAQDGYEELQGILYKYISNDMGATWKLDGRVML